ncbi:MAG: HEAT repeat domain-containing protein [Haloarculaceae archaeon]
MSTTAIDELLDKIRSGKPDEVGEAYQELVAVGDDNVAALRNALDDESELVRWAAVGVLGDIGARDAIEAVADRTEDTDVRVRVSAAQSLGQLGSAEGIPVLIEALQSDDVTFGHPPELVGDYAAQVLRSLTDEEFGFDASAAESDRAEAIEHWKEWWDNHEERFEVDDIHDSGNER